MNRKNIIYWLILAGVVGLVFLSEALTPKKIDWQPTYSAQDKNPYGSYLVFEELKHIFPGKKTQAIRSGFYDLVETDSTTPKNYICIDSDFSPDELETTTLLEMVHKGSNIFIATESLTGKLADTLSLNIRSDFKFEGKTSLNFVNARLKAMPAYTFEKSGLISYFAGYDSSRTVLLGKNNLNRPVFIQVPYGSGNFFISSTPIAFTNYHLLAARNAEFIARSFSYLPVADVVWNEYYKAGMPSPESDSPYRFLLKNPPLQWALYLSAAAILIFVFFEAKRKQRIIPILKPVSNTTLEFTKTVGGLYFQHGDHKNIAEKKILYFMETLRSRYFIKTTVADKNLMEQLSVKAGVSQATIQALFQKINFIRQRTIIAEEDLIALNTEMENFFRESQAVGV